MLNPAIECHVVYFKPSLQHHFFQFAITDPIFAISSNTAQDYLTLEPVTLWFC